jgi:hypothetical protein
MRWMVKVTLRTFLTRKIHGNRSIRVWMGPRPLLNGCGKSSPPTGIRSPDPPARSESLYRLRYSGSLAELVGNVKFDWAVVTLTAVTVDSYFVVRMEVIYHMLLAYLKYLPRPSLPGLNYSRPLTVHESAPTTCAKKNYRLYNGDCEG